MKILKRFESTRSLVIQNSSQSLPTVIYILKKWISIHYHDFAITVFEDSASLPETQSIVAYPGKKSGTRELLEKFLGRPMSFRTDWLVQTQGILEYLALKDSTYETALDQEIKEITIREGFETQKVFLLFKFDLLKYEAKEIAQQLTIGNVYLHTLMEKSDNVSYS